MSQGPDQIGQLGAVFPGFARREDHRDAGKGQLQAVEVVVLSDLPKFSQYVVSDTLNRNRIVPIAGWISQRREQLIRVLLL